MSFKDLAREPAVWAVPFTALIAWIAGRKQKAAEEKKITTEAELNAIDLQIKEDQYKDDKIKKLLERIIKSEDQFEELSKQFQLLSAKFSALLQENQEIIAELNLYKTIKN